MTWSAGPHSRENYVLNVKPKFTPEAGVRRTKESSENKVASDGDGYLFITCNRDQNPHVS